MPMVAWPLTPRMLYKRQDSDTFFTKFQQQRKQPDHREGVETRYQAPLVDLQEWKNRG